METLLHGSHYTFRGDTVTLIVLNLLCPSGFCNLNRSSNRIRHYIGVKNDASFFVSGRSSCRLHKTGFTAKKPFLVCIENGHESNLRQIKSFSEKIDANENVKVTSPQSTKYFNALDSVSKRFRASAARRFARLDVRKEGRLTFAEVKPALRELESSQWPLSSKGLLLAAFNSVDLDGDGHIDLNEWVALLIRVRRRRWGLLRSAALFLALFAHVGRKPPNLRYEADYLRVRLADDARAVHIRVAAFEERLGDNARDRVVVRPHVNKIRRQCRLLRW